MTRPATQRDRARGRVQRTTTRTASVPFCLAVGGFDPSGGAGVLADAAAIAAMGARPLAALTTVTVQTHTAFLAARPVAPRLLERQLVALLETYRPRTVKVGALPTTAHVRVLARHTRSTGIPLVLDPVLGASLGRGLVGPGTARALLRDLLPLATVVTPNAAEAAALTGRRIRDANDALLAGHVLLAAGARAVLVKGGHLPGGNHLLVTAQGAWTVPGGPRRRLRTHGSGCTLAAAIAGALATGHDLTAAIVRAQTFVITCFDLAATRRGPWGPDPFAALGDAAVGLFGVD